MKINQNLKKEAGKSESGFIKLIALIVITLIVLKFIGIDVSNTWDRFIFPILESGWDILVWIANFLYGFIKVFINAFKLIIEFFDVIIRG